MSVTRATFIQTVVVQDPDSHGDVELSVYKDPTSGSLFAIDSSYIEQVSIFVPGIYNDGRLQLDDDEEIGIKASLTDASRQTME
jgi:hypothetical protein